MLPSRCGLHQGNCCYWPAWRNCRSIVQLWPPARRSNIIFSSLAPFKAPRKRRTPRDRDVAFWSAEGLFFVTIYQRGVAIVNKLLIVVSGRRNFLQRQIEKCQARTLHSGLIRNLWIRGRRGQQRRRRGAARRRRN